jgi:hypothetical protein
VSDLDRWREAVQRNDEIREGTMSDGDDLAAPRAQREHERAAQREHERALWRSRLAQYERDTGERAPDGMWDQLGGRPPDAGVPGGSAEPQDLNAYEDRRTESDG